VVAKLSRLQSSVAVQAALNEFVSLGQAKFLEKYGFNKSTDFIVKDPVSGAWCDSKAIAGVAFGKQYPDEGPLMASEFSGGEATVVPKLRSLGFEVVKREDWTAEEVGFAVESYFRMLQLEAQQKPYKKSEFNVRLRELIPRRSSKSIEYKFQNISSVLHGLGLPFINGFKPLSSVQLLLRKSVQEFISRNSPVLEKIVDAMEEVKAPEDKEFLARLVEAPKIESISVRQEGTPIRLPRKIDFAGRDESNRKLGRAGEEWVFGFEHQRLLAIGEPDLLQKIEWTSELRGDGAGYDILSCESFSAPRYIEVKTTNGGLSSPFVISRNELEFSRDFGEEYYLYRVFQFRQKPMLYMLHGPVSSHVHLEVMDYRASFRKFIS
jgi:hypothetical protein